MYKHCQKLIVIYKMRDKFADYIFGKFLENWFDSIIQVSNLWRTYISVVDRGPFVPLSLDPCRDKFREGGIASSHRNFTGVTNVPKKKKSTRKKVVRTSQRDSFHRFFFC